jgi:type III secretion protein V
VIILLVRAFGTFVVRGNLVVGAVVLVVLATIQFIVIAKGGERVAEVGARFALDAMPGKQMTIDAELRAGTIDGNEARRQRRLLQRESQFHGAMDGAMKFVKGDVRLCSIRSRTLWDEDGLRLQEPLDHHGASIMKGGVQ